MGFVSPRGAVTQELMEKLTSDLFKRTFHIKTSIRTPHHSYYFYIINIPSGIQYGVSIAVSLS
jgi:hypothetical protein